MNGTCADLNDGFDLLGNAGVAVEAFDVLVEAIFDERGILLPIVKLVGQRSMPEDARHLDDTGQTMVEAEKQTRSLPFVVGTLRG